ncbi:hypothetical protein [Paraflavitalea speifideaquila]|uniref:hypothetical protein n=1 Tax=Paraflavitalea speifideaquila TaxID=3076558 RepID=UPI0028E7679C|nr:hypothetical protein [Paraflavitalea speifideiaquila]
MIYPDASGHQRAFYEGVYLNGKQVGIWIITAGQGARIISKEIYIDTTGLNAEVTNFYNNGLIESQGMKTAVVKKDSIEIVDIATEKSDGTL